MQTKDLKVGTDYAYQERPYWTTERVTVLETKATAKVSYGYYGATKNVTGVKVEFVTGDRKGDTKIVKPQTIKRTWSEEHAQRVATGKSRAEQARREQALRTERAEQAFALHQAMVAKGAKVGISYTYNDADFAALVAAGFKVESSNEHWMGSHLHSAVNGLSDLMREGVVDLEYVAVLLGLAQPPAPDDSLDLYDLDEA
jgi:hypothetical protein